MIPISYKPRYIIWHDKKLVEMGNMTEKSDADNNEVYLCKLLIKHVYNSMHLETKQIKEIKEMILPLVRNVTAKMLDNI